MGSGRKQQGGAPAAAAPKVSGPPALPVREVADGWELTADEVPGLLDALMDEARPLADRAAFLVALARRGETSSEIAHFVKVLRDKSVPFPAPAVPVVDVCGTGGDGRHTFNVSTCVSFILASAGVPVAKHGNRGVSSKSGSFDVLEELGIAVDLAPEQAAECLKRHQLCFLFAPRYHPVFKRLAPVRKAAAEQGSRTIFNLLGPLLNPARPQAQVVGVPSLELVGRYARAMRKCGLARGMAVCGRTARGEPMDEISVTGVSELAVFEGDTFRETDVELEFHAGDGVFMVNDARESAHVIRDILFGADQGPRRDLVLVNAAAALQVAGKVPDLQAGMLQALEELESGRVAGKLAELESFRP